MNDSGGRGKVERAAALSVLAALLLTILKLIVGYYTNSLGVISEALHSGLDLIAAGITLIAVQKASKQADSDHPYGHGKIENFAALAETILLWVTAGWIVYEALRRIAGEEFIEPNIWGIAVMLVSIFVDYERSKMLFKTAEEFDSQALEADALHFRTDMLSSVVVLIGLIFVSLGFAIGDPLGAMGVAIVILFVSYNLGKRSFDYLVDRAPEGVKEKIQEACSQIPGVLTCTRIRARTSGPALFVDIVVTVDETVTTGEAHHIADTIETELKDLASNVDVIVHIEPAKIDSDQYIKMNIYDQLQVLGRREKDIRNIHNIRVFSIAGGHEIAADLEMTPDLTLKEAHEISDRIEKDIKESIPKIKSVTFHMETALVEGDAMDITHQSQDIVEQVNNIVSEAAPGINCSSVVVRKEHGGISLLVDCGVDGSMPLALSHDIAEIIEKRIKETFSEIIYVFIHIEPI
ncbi:MAG: cation-efflux pump [Candidatus Thorarchaeota archaeon]|nr:MAG: cation-efflux pump [Candidatus Thorarchaeota archaeon]